ncbi:MAG TPA: hypothetical protein VK989_11605 [Polyangia bacterium]|jgi:hypothetical protein|nr:hypothetical protein [Polyangia bacterium]
MVAPQACVAVEITGSPAAQEQWSALERRCSDILGSKRCRLVPAGQDDAGAGCWRAVVTAEGGDTPTEASVVLSDETEPTHAPVRRDVTFRANDAVQERWATLGLVIAALVTVEEHSAAEAAPTPELTSAGGGFTPVVEARVEPPRAGPPFEGEVRASGVGGLGFLPGGALGVRGEISAAWRAFEIVGRGTLFPESNRASFGSTGAGGDLQLEGAGLGLCGRGARGRFGARVCVGGDLLHTSARGLGVSKTNVDRVWWGAAWTGASVELRLYRHLALALDAEVALLLERPTFEIVGESAEFTPSPVGGLLALGVAVPF